jgi:hypothetical protein
LVGLEPRPGAVGAVCMLNVGIRDVGVCRRHST